MKRVLLTCSLIATATLASADSTVTGFVQLHQAQRTQSLSSGTSTPAHETMVTRLEAEILYEWRADALGVTFRGIGGYDGAISKDLSRVREAFVDYSLGALDLDLRIGRQVLTWGVSEFLYVNDIFPKNFDAFFTGSGIDRMKEPVDAIRAVNHSRNTDWELVVSRARADTNPSPERFFGSSATRGAIEADRLDDKVDYALRAARHISGWDVAAYLSSHRSHQRRFFLESGVFSYDQPRVRHLGASVTGNFASGLVWVEAALEDASQAQENVVSRYSFVREAQFIAGYSRELGSSFSGSVQLNLEFPLKRDEYRRALAPGVDPVDSVLSTLHIRFEKRWRNDAVRAGSQLFLSDEEDSHINPFAIWSFADGWSVEGGANFFDGAPETRYGAFRDDSNLYVLGRYSF
jgi:hypothetical protein